MSGPKWLKFVSGAIAIGVAIAVAVNWSRARAIIDVVIKQPTPTTPVDALVQLVPGKIDTICLTSSDAVEVLGLQLAEVRQARAPRPLRLPGTLFLDPNRLARVHCRFGGEAVALGRVKDGDETRPLRYGDRVEKDQVLAVVWSKEIGEKKSELLDSLSRLDASRDVLARLTGLGKGIVSERSIHEAQRAVDADVISVSRAERTLRSWRVTDEEITAIHKELEQIKLHEEKAPGVKAKSQAELKVEREWAEVEVRSAIAGVIVEKNFNVGDMVDPADDLFKIADLSRLQVLANIYEEDLWAVRALSPEKHQWNIDLKSDPNDNHIAGTFDLIGSVIDPAQHTGVLMGWLDNSDGRLAVGQFITATIDLPGDVDTVAVPETALIEEGNSAAVFVETDRERREFTRRSVEVVRRSSGTIYLRSKRRDAETPPISAGDRVVTVGVLGLGGELSNLRANQTSLGTSKVDETTRLGLVR